MVQWLSLLYIFIQHSHSVRLVQVKIVLFLRFAKTRTYSNSLGLTCFRWSINPQNNLSPSSSLYNNFSSVDIFHLQFAVFSMCYMFVSCYVSVFRHDLLMRHVLCDMSYCNVLKNLSIDFNQL